jgi:branched-chain amino acid transport system permease protein
MFKIPRDKLIFFGGGLIVFAIVQVLISLGILNDFWITILLIGGVYAIVSIGLNLIYGFNGQFSLGQWGFYGIGAYASADITYRWVNDHSAIGLMAVMIGVILTGLAILGLKRMLSRIRGLDALSAFALYLIAVIIFGYLAIIIAQVITPPVTAFFLALPDAISTQIIFFLSVLLAGLLAAEISFLFGLPVLTLGSDYFGIATLGFTIIVKVLLDNSDTMLGFAEMKGARGMIGIPKLTTWAWLFVFLLLVVVVVRNLLHSSYGRAVISVREDEIAATAMGVNIADYKIIAFVIGSFFAGLAGGLYAHINGFLHPNNFNFIVSFNPMIIVVLGGLGSVTGTLAASFAWALLLEGVLRLVLPQGFETWRFVVYPLILLLVMLLRPSGMLGEYEMPFLRKIIPALPASIANRKTESNIQEGPGQAGFGLLSGTGDPPTAQEATE